MNRRHLRWMRALAVLALATAAAATAAGAHAAPRGGTITVLSAGDVDDIDPGRTYYAFTYEITYATQRPLLAYRPGSVEEVPDLAAAVPTVSKDGKTVTVKLRRGIRFGPPVGREVTSADVKYAIERGFSASVANGYAGAYFGGLVGAPAGPTKTVPDIRGIATPDRYTLVFRLRRPSGVFVGALSLPLTAPAPPEYARPFDAKASSDYGLHQVATGPYMIENDAAGRLTGYRPGQQIVLVRNPEWNRATSWRPAYADRIVFREGFADPTVMTRDILNGVGDVNGDTPPPAAELRSLLADPRERRELTFTPAGGERYVALNTSKPPFDDVRVRRAVAYALDRNAMRLTRGGAVDGRIATHFISPDFAGKGFELAGGYGFAPFRTPGFSGDVEKAKAMLRRAGYADGLYHGPPLVQVASATPPDSDTARVVAASLARIGMRVRTISVSLPVMFTRYCNVPKQEPNICPNVGWLPDFHEPQALLDPTFNGEHIPQVGNSNWPQLRDPRIDAAMDAAETIVRPGARYAAWARIDREVTETAAAIPWLWERAPTLFSPRVTHAPELWNLGSPDVTFMAVRSR